MDDLKPWWTSKAIWTGLIGSAWGKHCVPVCEELPGRHHMDILDDLLLMGAYGRGQVMSFLGLGGAVIAPALLLTREVRARSGERCALLQRSHLELLAHLGQVFLGLAIKPRRPALQRGHHDLWMIAHLRRGLQDALHKSGQRHLGQAAAALRRRRAGGTLSGHHRRTHRRLGSDTGPRCHGWTGLWRRLIRHGGLTGRRRHRLALRLTGGTRCRRLRPGQRAAEHLRAQQLESGFLCRRLVFLYFGLSVLCSLIAGVDRGKA